MKESEARELKRRDLVVYVTGMDKDPEAHGLVAICGVIKVQERYVRVKILRIDYMGYKRTARRLQKWRASWHELERFAGRL